MPRTREKASDTSLGARGRVCVCVFPRSLVCLCLIAWWVVLCVPLCVHARVIAGAWDLAVPGRVRTCAMRVELAGDPPHEETHTHTHTQATHTHTHMKDRALTGSSLPAALNSSVQRIRVSVTMPKELGPSTGRATGACARGGVRAWERV
jgi:hypothetical protein